MHNIAIKQQDKNSIIKPMIFDSFWLPILVLSHGFSLLETPRVILNRRNIKINEIKMSLPQRIFKKIDYSILFVFRNYY